MSVFIVGFLLVGACSLAVARIFFPLISRFEDPQVDATGPALTPPALGRMTHPFAEVLPISDAGRARLRRELTQAGYYHEISLANFLSVRNAAVLSWVLFITALVTFEAVPLVPRFWLVAVGGLVAVFGVPRVVLSSRASRRVMAIQNDLPDALDMMTMMMSGGLTMEGSLSNVIGEFRETHPDLATELGIVARQTKTGSFDQAMMSFAERLDLPDITTLAALMRRSNRLGGRIVDSLREYADSMRRIRHQNAEERGNKASVKLLLPVLFCLAPPIYVLLLGPSVLELQAFISRENQPGGILTPSVSEANEVADQLVRDAARR